MSLYEIAPVGGEVFYDEITTHGSLVPESYLSYLAEKHEKGYSLKSSVSSDRTYYVFPIEEYWYVAYFFSYPGGDRGLHRHPLYPNTPVVLMSEVKTAMRSLFGVAC